MKTGPRKRDLGLKSYPEDLRSPVSTLGSLDNKASRLKNTSQSMIKRDI